MQIMKDNLDEMNCVMMQQMLQARAGKNNKCETVKYATKVVESMMQGLQAKQEEEGKLRAISESWQEQEGEVNRRGCLPPDHARAKVVPERSGIFGSSKSPASNSDSKSPETERPQQLIRKAPPSHMRSAVVKEAPPLLTTHDARVNTLGRRLKKASVHLRKMRHGIF